MVAQVQHLDTLMKLVWSVWLGYESLETLPGDSTI